MTPVYEAKVCKVAASMAHNTSVPTFISPTVVERDQGSGVHIRYLSGIQLLTTCDISQVQVLGVATAQNGREIRGMVYR